MVSLTAYLILAIALSLTRAPWWDEGVFADPAWRFATIGKFGSVCLDPRGYRDFPGVHEYTYWQFPGYLVLTGLLFRITGLSVITMRAISIFFGLAYVLGWRKLLDELTAGRNFANLAAAFLAMDFVLGVAATNGRMDLMCAAGGIWGLAMLAAYARRGRVWMLLASGAALAGGAVTHPTIAIYGALWLVLAFGLFLSGWDLRRAFPFRRIALFLSPAVLLFAIWGMYLVQDWPIFRGQMAALNNRVPHTLSPLVMLKREANRYGDAYLRGGLQSVRGVFPLAFLAALLSAGVLGRLRGSTFIRLAAGFFVSVFLVVALIDTQALYAYVLHTQVFGMMLTAAVLFAYAGRGGRGRVLAAVIAGFLAAINLGGSVLRMRVNTWRQEFDPVIALIRPAAERGASIIGGSELGFGIGFTPQLDDDRYLGMLCGRTAEYVVMNGDYTILSSGHRNAWQAGRAKLASDFDLLLENPRFRVYRRKAVCGGCR